MDDETVDLVKRMVGRHVRGVPAARLEALTRAAETARTAGAQLAETLPPTGDPGIFSVVLARRRGDA